MLFVNIQLNQIQNCSIQIKKMKARIFSFQMKKKLLANINRHRNVLFMVWLQDSSQIKGKDP